MILTRNELMIYGIQYGSFVRDHYFSFWPVPRGHLHERIHATALMKRGDIAGIGAKAVPPPRGVAGASVRVMTGSR